LATILFDLDGTLTNPKKGIAASVGYALERVGSDISLTQEELNNWIGPPIHLSFKKIFDDPAEVEKATVNFRERFSTLGLYENEVYDGVYDAVATLKGRGHKLVVATSKPSIYAIKIMNHFELTRYFMAVHGSELNGTRSDKSELISWIKTQYSRKDQPAVMVGDRRYDIIGAKNNDIPAIGVLYGYGSKEELAGAGAICLCERPADVTEALETLL